MQAFDESRELYCRLPSHGRTLLEQCILDPQTAYDLGADYYDLWKWQQIWREIEWPCIDDMLSTIERNSGGLYAILDVGVGSGSYLQHIATKFDVRACYGVDVSARMLALAKTKLQDRAVLTLGDARNLQFSDGRFDVVLLRRVGSHLSDIKCAASEIRRVLRCGGFLILSDLDPRHPYQFTRIPYGFSKISVSTYKHSVEEWTVIAAQLGFRVQIQYTIWSDAVRGFSASNLPSSLASSPAHPVAFIMEAQKFTC